MSDLQTREQMLLNVDRESGPIVGQVWADNDTRGGQRLFRVLAVEEHQVQIQTCNRGASQRKSWTSKKRFFSRAKTGYTLHSDGSSTAAAATSPIQGGMTPPIHGESE